jgi:tetratricopeptide (TPR) repeat protein
MPTWQWPRFAARSNGTGERPKTSTEPQSRFLQAANRFYASFLAAMSRFGEAKAEADRACDVDPFCLVVTTNAAWVRYAATEFGAAIDRSRYVLDMDSGYMPARRMLGAALLGAGRPEEAVEELAAAAGSGGDDPISLAWLAHAKAHAGARDEAAAILTRLETAGGPYVPGYHLALAHVGLGNRDAAFKLLERACADREPYVINLKVEPRFDPLRRDPRYGVLLQRLRLPE